VGIFTAAEWDAALSGLIRADGTASAVLPDGRIIWTFGDTTAVRGVKTTGYYGYPHGSMATQIPGTLDFGMVPGRYGVNYGGGPWQQVPNWPDGSWFWMYSPVVDDGMLYVLGVRVAAKAGGFIVLGSYAAEFDAVTLAYRGITALPDGGWGAAAPAAGGWLVTGGRQVPGCVPGGGQDCKYGAVAFVPAGAMGDAGQWQVTADVIMPDLMPGTILAILPEAPGWRIFTKRGDAYLTNSIEALTAADPAGPWTLAGTWPAPVNPGDLSYGVQAHPEQEAPPGQVLVSYNVSGSGTDYHPLFLYLPVT
jgi:hypothetical protein